METLENKTNQTQPTKEPQTTGILLTHGDAEEYRAYKKQKKIGEITSAFARTETPIDGKASTERVCEHAIRLRQAAIKVNLRKLMELKDRFAKTAIKLDCAIGNGGNGGEIKSARNPYGKAYARQRGERRSACLVAFHLPFYRNQTGAQKIKARGWQDRFQGLHG